MIWMTKGTSNFPKITELVNTLAFEPRRVWLLGPGHTLCTTLPWSGIPEVAWKLWEWCVCGVGGGGRRRLFGLSPSHRTASFSVCIDVEKQLGKGGWRGAGRNRDCAGAVLAWASQPDRAGSPRGYWPLNWEVTQLLELLPAQRLPFPFGITQTGAQASWAARISVRW